MFKRVQQEKFKIRLFYINMLILFKESAFENAPKKFEF